MKKLLSYVAVVVATLALTLAATSLAGPMSQSTLAHFPYAQQVQRPCIYQSGGWTEIDCSAGAAYSAELTDWAKYSVQAHGGDVYLARATAGSGQDADSNDGYLPEGAWIDVFTDGTAFYLTCDGSAATATLRYWECK